MTANDPKRTLLDPVEEVIIAALRTHVATKRFGRKGRYAKSANSFRRIKCSHSWLL